MAKYFKFSSNKSPVKYECGEKMFFEIKAVEDGKEIACDNIKWVIRGDDGVKTEGTGSCKLGETLKLEASLSKPGFVHINCTALDESGEKIEDFDVLDAGAGADVEKIRYCDTIPDDFDDYWNDIRNLVASFSIQTEIVSEHDKMEGFKAYDIRIKTPDGRPASGCVSYPLKEGKYPIILHFNGYSVAGSEYKYEKDAIVGVFNAHGIENNVPCPELTEKYKELSGYGFNEEENASNMTTYWRNMMIRNLMALKYLKTLPCWDGKNISVRGGSQGALQATTVAANDKDVNSLEIIVPWFCNLNAENHGFLQGWRPKFAQGLRYFDTVAQGTRVKCPVKIDANLGDYVCPPSSVMALYNEMKTEKSIEYLQSGTHSYWPIEREQFKV